LQGGVLRRGVLVDGTVALAVILGVVGTLVAYPAGAKPGSGHGTQGLATALKRCKKDRSKRNRKKCEKTTRAKYKSKTKTGGHAGVGAPTDTGAATGATETGASTGTVPGTGTATGATGTPGTATGTPTGTTGTATGMPEALSATLIVHVLGCQEIKGTPEDERALERELEEAAAAEPVGIVKLGPAGEVLTKLVTGQHTVHVAPGTYEIRASEKPSENWPRVTVTAGQTQEVTLPPCG
jgi:hypothetical protein